MSYTWYMRSADWLTHRDINAARASWERARAIADKLPVDEEDTLSKRIAPRAALTFTEWLVGGAADGERCFDELREMAMQSGDLLPLAVGMSGRVTTLIITYGRLREASAMAAELEELADKIGGKALTNVDILLALALAQYEGCEFAKALRTTDRVRALVPAPRIDDLAPATALAGIIKVLTGRRAEGRRDLQDALSLAHSDALTYAIVVGWNSDPVVLGFELVDEDLVNETEMHCCS